MSKKPQTERFKVLQGSQSAHCCFEVTVIDTTKPSVLAQVKGYEDSCEAICECFEIADANKICAALNAAEDPNEEEGTDL